ncbi:cyclic pyranopterin monophosphate synthase subunit MoaC [Desulfosporosinus acidiphilus SJ4]|uniref:Cyclic pyranopterin monophosphate synthase n=1 Tax=Desulfosporosinus acidiphilus (strain DSM 22704 / JCM 16185 / SJ4) TaxID=646529 RepID=I4D218_DESAJ|nr:cyclic pyranopterin monophosphate synthase MoaC [Desulfosporosinus acidiphilus]AFM39842.1 cyclic pyranopterin monophosphate synthase subunit MoaC [Desulfosporosinus acidiphilus SJ4]
MEDLTHFDEQGRARMVDISDKAETSRVAVAHGNVLMQQDTLERIRAGRIAKGDVLAVAQVAGIMAAKQTSQLIPMCHPLGITGAKLSFHLKDPGEVEIEAIVKVQGKTGVEMEALTAVSVAALTIYDMCKAIDKSMTIGEIYLVEKQGGKSGHYVR